MNPPGFYGKLPTLGDFVTRRLPRSFVQIWDEWLQSAIAASHERLGSKWLDHYLVSPIWRFALSPGICSDSAWAGIMMPSVDRVGRYFPLTLASPVGAAALLPLLLDSGGWFSDLERLALSGLEDGFDLERFDAQLQTLNPPDWAARGSQPLARAQTGRFALCLDLKDTGEPACSLMSLSVQLLADFLPDHSLWSTVGSEHIESTLVVCQGLPPVDAYGALISGQWEQRGWAMRKVPTLQAGFPAVAGTVAPACSGRSHALSVVGNRRKLNEDSFLDQSERGLWVVADGMGGHQAGDVASRAIVESLASLRLPSRLDERLMAVRACLERVNGDLCRLSGESSSGQIIGSTVVVLLASAGEWAFLWAGDSRLYRWRSGRIEQLNWDHAAHMRTYGESAPTGPGRFSAITRAVGGSERLELDSGYCDAAPGDRFLLCSDGLDKELSVDEIAEQLARGDCEASAKALIEKALARVGRDNITVIVVDPGGR